MAMSTQSPQSPQPHPVPSHAPPSTDTRTAASDAGTRHADAVAAAQLDPLGAAHQAALAPGPVYYLPDQGAGNPGVQGWVFRPHQEKNPGTNVTPLERDREAIAKQVQLEHDARGRAWDAYRMAAQARGETVPERLGPVRLQVHLDITAHSLVDEDKLPAVARAADALVAAMREAGVDPKAHVSGVPI